MSLVEAEYLISSRAYYIERGKLTTITLRLKMAPNRARFRHKELLHIIELSPGSEIQTSDLFQLTDVQSTWPRME